MMSKKFVIFIVLLVSFLLVLFLLEVTGVFQRYKYSVGKDTAKVYGDGEFQVGYHEGIEFLRTEKYHVTLIRCITQRKSIGKTVYFIGTDTYSPNYGTRIYGVLSVETNRMELFWSGTVDAEYMAEMKRLPDQSNIVIHSSSAAFLQEDWNVLQELEEK